MLMFALYGESRQRWRARRATRGAQHERKWCAQMMPRRRCRYARLCRHGGQKMVMPASAVTRKQPSDTQRRKRRPRAMSPNHVHVFQVRRRHVKPLRTSTVHAKRIILSSMMPPPRLQLPCFTAGRHAVEFLTPLRCRRCHDAATPRYYTRCRHASIFERRFVTSAFAARLIVFRRPPPPPAFDMFSSPTGIRRLLRRAAFRFFQLAVSWPSPRHAVFTPDSILFRRLSFFAA